MDENNTWIWHYKFNREQIGSSIFVTFSATLSAVFVNPVLSIVKDIPELGLGNVDHYQQHGNCT